MTAFAVLSIEPNSALDEAVAASFPEASLQVAPNTWLVASKGLTTREVSERIKVKPGGIGGVVVVKIDGYFGFASSNIWEWLKVKTAEAPDGEDIFS